VFEDGLRLRLKLILKLKLRLRLWLRLRFWLRGRLSLFMPHLHRYTVLAGWI
jgi:hypothetical protein